MLLYFVTFDYFPFFYLENFNLPQRFPPKKKQKNPALHDTLELKIKQSPAFFQSGSVMDPS